jgi:hypothetical protein
MMQVGGMRGLSSRKSLLFLALPILVAFYTWREYILLPLPLPAALHRLSDGAAARRTLRSYGRHPCGPTPFRSRGAVCNMEKYVPERLGTPWTTSFPSPGSCCAVSDTYRFIFVKIAKTASSTTLVAYLRPHICPPRGDGSEKTFVYRDAPYAGNCSTASFLPTENDCYPCTEIPRWKWVHYYVFAIVRHPVSRAVSSYTYCKKAEAGVLFSEWCVNPDRGGGICGSTPDAPNVHWGAQAADFCTAARPGVEDPACAVDFVGKTESYMLDMDVIVQSINAGREAGAPQLPLYSSVQVELNRQNKSSRPNLLDLPENAHCRQALQSWYSADMRVLGYS